MYRCTGVQVGRCTGGHVYWWASVLVGKCTGVHLSIQVSTLIKLFMCILLTRVKPLFMPPDSQSLVGRTSLSREAAWRGYMGRLTDTKGLYSMY